jgi:hypothetical protein
MKGVKSEGAAQPNIHSNGRVWKPFSFRVAPNRPLWSREIFTGHRHPIPQALSFCQTYFTLLHLLSFLGHIDRCYLYFNVEGPSAIFFLRLLLFPG